MKKFNRETFKELVFRRRSNTLGLIVLTVGSALITFLCALSGFAHTDILVIVTLCMILLCCIQFYKLRISFRTIPHFKGSRRRKKQES